MKKLLIMPALKFIIFFIAGIIIGSNFKFNPILLSIVVVSSTVYSIYICKQRTERSSRQWAAIYSIPDSNLNGKGGGGCVPILAMQNIRNCEFATLGKFARLPGK